MSFRRNLAIYAISLTALFSSASAVRAGTLSYTFSGVGSGTISGVDFTDAAFTVSFIEDTSSITSPDTGYFAYSGISGIFTEGSYAATLTGTGIEVNGNASTGVGNFEDVFLFNSDFGSSIGISQDPTLLGYTLSTPITTGVITGSQIGAAQDVGGFSTTSGDVIEFNSLSSLDFTAADAAPEPASPVLAAAGLVLCGLIRLRGPGTRV